MSEKLSLTFIIFFSYDSKRQDGKFKLVLYKKTKHMEKEAGRKLKILKEPLTIYLSLQKEIL